MLRLSTNPLCFTVVLAGFMIYVGLYSLYLKRHTVYRGLIGSLAGAAILMPTLGGYTGYIYLGVAAALDLSQLYLAWSGQKTSDDRVWAKKLFISSILTIMVLSVMMSVDVTVPVTPNVVLACAP